MLLKPYESNKTSTKEKEAILDKGISKHDTHILQQKF